MARGLSGVTLAGLNEVFVAGSLSGLNEAQLLERYVRLRDERAFEVLVSRHGPMVLGICRRLLGEPHDVEDAFQATFLILVRKAGTLHDPRRLCPWLYGVAYRVASRARAGAIGRKLREPSSPNADPADTRPQPEPERGEIRQLFDEELNRLPEKYRVPLVLCHLEGLTHDEAAARLGWPLGTVRSRLARGRDRLRDRLTHRGFAPAIALIEPGTWPNAASPEVPPSLIQSVVETATRTSLGKTLTAATVSGSVAALTDGVIQSMWIAQLKPAAALVFALAVVGSGTVLVAQTRERAVDRPTPDVTAVSTSEAASPVGSTTQTPAPSTDDAAATPRVAPRELLIRLDHAVQRLKRQERMLKVASINQSMFDDTTMEVAVLRAQIAEACDALEEEKELLQARLLAKRAAIQGAQFRLRQAELDDASLKKMREKGAISAEEKTRGESELGVARSQLDQLKPELTLIEIRLKYVARRLSLLAPANTPSDAGPKGDAFRNNVLRPNDDGSNPRVR